MTEYIQPMILSSKTNYSGNLNKDNVIEKNKNGINLDFSKLGKKEIKITNDTPSNKTVISAPKRTTRTAKPKDIITTNTNTKEEENIPYEQKFIETDNIVRSTLSQIDQGLLELSEDITVLRNSKNVRSKYNYISLLQGTRSSLISNKLTAARELNNTIIKSCDLELRRAKDMKTILDDQKNDTKAVMDMYKAFVNAPVGTNYNNSGTNSLGPSISQLSTNRSNVHANIISSINPDDLYNDYKQNMTPQQHMMSLERDPNIQQVVVWNKNTGTKSFEIMNMQTGEILQNVDKHDIMFMEDTTIDEYNGIARNVNLNETYPLIIYGQSSIDEY